MKTGLIGFSVRLPAAVAVFAFCVITTAAATPGLFHGDDLTTVVSSVTSVTSPY